MSDTRPSRAFIEALVFGIIVTSCVYGAVYLGTGGVLIWPF